MNNLIEGLKLMAIGLSTVFVVLLIIINFGKALILFVNRFFPEEEKPITKTTSSATDSQVEQAIALAIEKLTNGKGKVEKIEKL